MGLRSTPAGVSYEELEGSPTFKYTHEGMTAQRVLRIAWADIDSLVDELYGKTLSAGGEYIWADLLKFPGKTWLYAHEMSVDPFDPENPNWDAATGINKYDAGAKVTISYLPDPYMFPFIPSPEEEEGPDTEDGPARVYTRSIGGEVMTLPNHGFGWYTAQDPGEPFKAIKSEDVRVGKVMPTIEHTLYYPNLPNPPWSAIRSAVGTINSTTGPFGAPKRTVMFLGAEGRRKMSIRGERTWELTYRFSERAGLEPINNSPIEWVKFFDPILGIWRTVVDRNGNYCYRSTNHTLLFLPPMT